MTSAATPSFEASAVALCLSAITRLQLSFGSSNSTVQSKALVACAGDMLDHTVPFTDLKHLLAKAEVSEQVNVLVNNRERIAAVPPGLWRKAKGRPSDLGGEHYSGYRAVENALKRDFSRPEVLWPSLEAWLAPAWERYPQLKSEALLLKNATPAA